MALVHTPSAIVGAVVAAIIVAVLLEMRSRNMQAVETTKLTTAWRISELGKPLILARDVLEVDVPAGAKIVASGLVDSAVFSACEVRQVPNVRVEGAVDIEGGRALVFLAGARRGSMAMVTTDPKIVGRLASEARTAWEQGDPYMERGTIAELAGRQGVSVETQGMVQEILPYRDQFMIRLADDGEMIGVLVPKDPHELVGFEVRVQGRLDRDRSGYPVIEATDVRRVH